MGFNSDSSLPTSADENNSYSYRIYAGTRGIVETSAAKDSATEPTSRRNTKVQSCDRCRAQRYRCVKITGEEFTLCTQCASSGQECTYLRPIGRPGPVPGAKRTPTPRKTAFLDQRSLSPEDYKDGNIKNTPSLAAAGIAHRGDKITTDATKVQSRVRDRDRSRSTDARTPDSSCICSVTGTNRQHERLEQVANPHPLFWLQTRSEPLNSTWVRNKKHLFSD